jgi:antibiotic biosynthesis monooxygenase (ABM) superfamily enzyme
MTREAPPPIPRAPRYKQAVITWLGVYPPLTLTLAVLGPVMETWPLPLRTLLVTILLVPALTWLILPFLTRVFRGWMFRSN